MSDGPTPIIPETAAEAASNVCNLQGYCRVPTSWGLH